MNTPHRLSVLGMEKKIIKSLQCLLHSISSAPLLRLKNKFFCRFRNFYTLRSRARIQRSSNLLYKAPPKKHRMWIRNESVKKSHGAMRTVNWNAFVQWVCVSKQWEQEDDDERKKDTKKTREKKNLEMISSLEINSKRSSYAIIEFQSVFFFHLLSLLSVC